MAWQPVKEKENLNSNRLKSTKKNDFVFHFSGADGLGKYI